MSFLTCNRYRAHGRFLMGDALGAKADLEKSLDLVPDFIQALVKIASVHVELGQWSPLSWNLRIDK